MITEFADAGAETCLTHLACGLDRQRFQPHVYSLAKPPASQRAKLVGKLSAADVPVHFLGLSSNLQLPSAVRRMRDHFREDSIDLVHSFLFHANVVSELARRWAHVKRHVAGVRVAQRNWWRTAVLKRITAHVDRISCVSESVRQQLVSGGIAATDRTCVIPNGVDLPELAPESTRGAHSPNQPFILALARFDRQKGIDLLLEAADGFLDKLPQYELWIAGDGPDRAKLARQADRCKNHQRVRFLEWQQDPGPLLAQAALFVLPSRWEGMPNVLLQAMAFARPVVCTDVEGVTEVLGAEGEPQIVLNEDVNAMSQRIVDLATDADLRQRLGQLNRQRVVQHFSIETMVDRYAQLFEEVLAGNSPEF